MSEQQRWPCIVCHQDPLEPTELQTCVGCVSRTRSALLEIVELYALLPETMADHAGASTWMGAGGGGMDTAMVGSDAMVLYGPGSDGANQTREILHSDDPEHAAPHADDEWPGDAPSVLGELERWERDWRHTLGLRPATTEATVSGCASFLDENLTRMAQNTDSDFAAFATDMHRLRTVLHRVTSTGEHVEYGVPCLDCETRLVRRARDPKPCRHEGPHRETCNQGGLSDWRCPDRECSRTRYDEADYLLACAEHWRRQGLDSEAC